MWRFVTSGIILMMTASIMSCSGGRSPDRIGTSENSVSLKILPLPVVPDTITTAKSRAGYLLRHFWDSLSFESDTTLTRDTDFMEQNFVNYVSIFSEACPKTARCTTNRLMHEARKDSASYCLLVDIAEKYLDDPESPMLDEDAYDMFVCAEMKAEETDAPETPR